MATQSWANLTAADCFALPAADQVSCSSQFLNITDPPSIYDWTGYSYLWQPVTCLLSNVTYSNRVDMPADFNFCSVPLEGNDAFLFASIAMLATACLFGKLAVVWVLIAGGLLGTLNYYADLREVSNGISLWLGISPPDLFFYAFIPPLAVDSAIRLDFFMFRKTWVHMLLTAFVMVILSAFLLTPIVLFAMGFQSRGFNWCHVSLFAAMIASTDALSVTAILKKTGGPDRLVTLIEGESLLNDASAITLFEVFKRILEQNNDPSLPFPSVWTSIPTILLDTLKLAGIGCGVGLAMSMALGYLLRWLRWRGAKPYVESVAVLSASFLSFYAANSPAGGSGVIAVVVFGLWGNYTSKWGMLASSEQSGAFDAFWDALCFGANGLVFFFSGAACINFFIRSVGLLSGSPWSWGAIPVIFVVMILLRTGCIAIFNLTFFRWLKETLTWPEVAFSGWAGLRGSVSLIMIADYLNYSELQPSNASHPGSSGYTQEFVNAEITLWTSAFVLLTLLINAPTLSPLVRFLKLDGLGLERRLARSRAKRALCRFTTAAIDSLRGGEGAEFLQGQCSANWEAVAHYCDVSTALPSFEPLKPKKKKAAVPAQAEHDGAAPGNQAEGRAVSGGAPNGGGGGGEQPLPGDPSPPQRPRGSGSGGGGVGRDGSNVVGGEWGGLDVSMRSGSSYSRLSDYDGGSDADSICAEVAQELPFLQAAQPPQPPQRAQQAAQSPAQWRSSLPTAPQWQQQAQQEQQQQQGSADNLEAGETDVEQALGKGSGGSAVTAAAAAAVAAGAGAAAAVSPQLPAVPAGLPAVPAASDGAASEDADSLYYASMPAAVGKRLLHQLQLTRLSVAGSAGGSGAGGSAGTEAPPLLLQYAPPPAAASPTASSSGERRGKGKGAVFPEEHADYYSSVPAAVGSRLKQQLQQQLAEQKRLHQPRQRDTPPATLPPAAATPAGPTALPARPLSSGPRTYSGLLPTPEEGAGPAPRQVPQGHHMTISGASGATLAAELQRQLASSAAQRSMASSQPAPPALALRQRDLLGRKLLPPAATTAGPAGRLLRLLPSGAAATSAAAFEVKSSPSSPTGSTPASLPMTAVAPTGAPLSAQLQLRRVRTFHDSPQPARGGGAGPASGAGSPGRQALAGFFTPARLDKSWQHRPLPGRPGPVAGATASATRAASSQAPTDVASQAGSMGWDVFVDGQGNGLGDLEGDVPCEGDAEIGNALPYLRGRLLAGLKRQFHARRMQGLLSAEGLRILDFVCGRASEQAGEPLCLWALLEQEVQGGAVARLTARTLLGAVRIYSSLPRLLKALVSWPFRKLSGWLRGVLGRRMLTACEVAVECWMALAQSPPALYDAAAAQFPEQAWALQQEVEADLAAAHAFISEREAEAPERYQAIQSYRAAVAVLRQQTAFVQELFMSGMVDGGEREEMVEELEQRLRQLELTGPVWKPPRPRAVLRALPFLRHMPTQLLNRVLAAGSIQEFHRGEEFWSAGTLPPESGAPTFTTACGPGIFVVLGGVIRRRQVRADGSIREYSQGTGGVVGPLAAVAGSRFPGSDVAVAEGNSLGKGPMLFHLPQAALERWLEDARLGKPAAVQMRLELLRLATFFVLECTEQDVAAAVQQRLLAAQERARLRPRPSAHGGGGKQAAPGSTWAGRDLPPLSPAMPAVLGLKTQHSNAQLAEIMQKLAEDDDVKEEELTGAGGTEQRPRPPSVARVCAAQVIASLRKGLHSAELLEMQSGATFAQGSHAVLLRGRLLRQGGGRGSDEEAAEVTAPAVVLWMGDTLREEVQGTRWLCLGAGGVLLMACKQPETGAAA